MARIRRLQPNPRFPNPPGRGEGADYMISLVKSLTTRFREINDQVNRLSEGRQEASYNEHSAVPTSGIFDIGDFIRNQNPSHTGTVGSRYILAGWTCIQEGSASASSFVEARLRTGD